MFEFMALITNKGYWRFHSMVIALILKACGIKVGRKFYIEGVPKLKIRGRAGDIQIGDNVSVFGNIDLRNREQGKILIKDGVSIDNDCRFVSANDSVLTIGERSSIGPYCIFNCGVSVTVGSDCLFAGSIQVQSSEHGFAKGELIRKQKHTYGEISIGNDVWLAVNSAVMKGAVIEDGCVIGAKSLVRSGLYKKNSILVGVPARIVKERQ